jgi:hypothetical protein
MKDTFDIVLNRYKKCKVICETIYKYIKKETRKSKSIIETRIKGQEYAKECINIATSGMKSEEYKIWSPITISKNNWMNMWDDKELEFEEGDIIKVEFAITDESVIYWCGETFVYGENKESKRIIENMRNIPINLCKNVYGEVFEDELELVNDTIRQYIESECTKFNCYPVENVTSYRDPNSLICKKSEKSEYTEVKTNQIILGYKRKLSKDQEWILVDNPCCMIEEGDVYNLEISIIKDRESSISSLLKENEHEYKEEESELYRLDFKQKKILKTASGRDFYNRIKKEYGEGIFRKSEKVKNIKDKLGFRECNNANLFTEYPTKKADSIVYTTRTVVYYKDGRLNIL